MENLRNNIIEIESKQFRKDVQDFRESLKEVKENELTGTEKWLGISKIYLKNREQKVINKLEKKMNKNIQEEITKINEVEKAPDNLICPYVISISFYKNRTWGYCPIGEDNRGNKTSSITGYGYDKESTASGRLLSMNKTILKRMYKLMNDNLEGNRREILGYGSGYGNLPYFEGGMGIECHVDILKRLGFKVQKTGTNSVTILTVSEN